MLSRQLIGICRNPRFSLVMSSPALERVIANNKLAEQTLLALKREFSSVREDEINKKIREIQEENDALKRQVEIAKQQLIKLEISNGKQQVPLPDVKGSAAVPAPVAAPKPEPAAAAQPAKTDDKSQKKEKPKKEKAPPAEKAAPVVEVMDVSRLDMRIGKIVEVSRHPDADGLYLEKIDCGEEQPRTVISGLVKFIPIEEMKDRMCIVMCNLKPAKMRGILSEAMVMCASTPEKVEIMSPPAGAVPGDLVSCEGFARNPDLPFMNPKKKIFEAVAPDLKVNEALEGTYQGAKLVVEGKGPIKSQTLKGVNIK